MKMSAKSKANGVKPNLHKPRVAAIAIAKDEGPYLHEWIHHCMYFGFTDVFIGINRTSDNSMEILKKIQKQYPNVHFESLDWMDKVDIPLHVPAITYLFHKVASQYPDISHAMVIDLDEFWMPLDFKRPLIN